MIQDMMTRGFCASDIQARNLVIEPVVVVFRLKLDELL